MPPLFHKPKAKVEKDSLAVTSSLLVNWLNQWVQPKPLLTDVSPPPAIPVQPARSSRIKSSLLKKIFNSLVILGSLVVIAFAVYRSFPKQPASANRIIPLLSVPSPTP